MKFTDLVELFETERNVDVVVLKAVIKEINSHIPVENIVKIKKHKLTPENLLKKISKLPLDTRIKIFNIDFKDIPICLVDNKNKNIKDGDVKIKDIDFTLVVFSVVAFIVSLIAGIVSLEDVIELFKLVMGI